MLFMFVGELSKRGNRLGLGGYAVAVVIVLQVATPAIALMGTKPARFGFQMYSGLGAVKVTAVNDRAENIPVNPEAEIAGLLRPDVDWTGVLPERICDSYPSAARVTVEQPGRQRTIECD